MTASAKILLIFVWHRYILTLRHTDSYNHGLFILPKFFQFSGQLVCLCMCVYTYINTHTYY